MATDESGMSARPVEEIVAEHGRTVLRVCRAVLGPVDAEDAWSETFLAALSAYPRLRANSNIEAWLAPPRRDRRGAGAPRAGRQP